MTEVFVDTAFWIATISPKDTYDEHFVQEGFRALMREVP